MLIPKFLIDLDSVMSLSKQLVRFLHSRFFQVAVPAMGISRRLKKSRRSGRFSNVHLFLLTVASAMKCQVQTEESGQYSYVASIFKVRSQKKITGLFGNFSQMADPPPIPPFWEPLIQKKNYRLFCILDP